MSLGDKRIEALETWLTEQAGLSGFSLRPASGDASFRRYFRVTLGARSYIAMDAPPDKEDCRPFVRVARQFRAAGLNVPTVHCEALEQGFLLLDDFGSTAYLEVLDAACADRLYGDAIAALVRLQRRVPAAPLPPYDRALLMREMALFPEWLLQRHLGLSLAAVERSQLSRIFALLVDNALEQPRVAVHRDYHSRNLMRTEPNPGILDFQDAVNGPVTYDLVSLLRDCYIEWPEERVEAWAMAYFRQAVECGVLSRDQEPRFLPWFDLMGLQRHLKAAGIFARLYRRDDKSGYLKDIPLTLRYLARVAARYPRLEPLAQLIRVRVLPALGDCQ